MDSRAERQLGKDQDFFPKKLRMLFFAGGSSSDKPQALRAIFRISSQMGESSCIKTVEVFLVRRAETESLGIFHWGALVSAL
jgi:hypothetical protein